MAINKNALIRYQALDKCFKNTGRKYFMDDLIESCDRALAELNPNSRGISVRQVYDDIRYMESEVGWAINLKRGKVGKKNYYYYEDRNFSISNQPFNKYEAEQIKSALFVLSRFKGLPQFNWVDEQILKLEQAYNLKDRNHKIIDFDNNEYLIGLEFLSLVFNAILYTKVISIEYRSFVNSDSFKHVIHPYYLKQYNNRWFLLGKNPLYETLSILALDRMVTVEELNDKYISTSIDFGEYFEDVVGVTIPMNAEPSKVRIQIAASLWPYVKTKPMHGSQKIRYDSAEYAEIELTVFVNYELISLLFSYGDRITVLEPFHLQEKMLEQAKSIVSKYEK